MTDPARAGGRQETPVSRKRRYDFPRARPGAETHVFRCQSAGLRLDQYLVTRFTGYSRTFLAGLIRQGRVLVAGGTAKPGRRLLPDEEITVLLPEAIRSAPEEMDVELLHEDDFLFAVNKPPGVVVHPARGHLHGTLYHGLLWRFRKERERDPEFRVRPVHRLDRDTSGLLLYAKDAATQRRLAAALEKRRVRKLYLAVCHGRLPFDSAVLDGAIGADERAKRMVIDGERARPARTGVRLLSAAGGCSLVECDLLTGRCHQIRVHLAALGRPIVGDLLYGGRRATESGEPLIARQALHAWRLVLEHPADGRELDLAAPPPDDFSALVRRLGLEAPAP